MGFQIYAIVSVLAVSLIAVLAVLPIYLKKTVPQRLLLFLLSISVGVLLATVFLDFLPEAYEHYNSRVPILIFAGFLSLFVLEKLVHYHHNKKCEDGDCGHGHAYQLAPVNLIGDGIHNFLDGLVIAGSYAVSTVVGITATISIVFHEIPQEVADFGVLLYSGMSKKRALVFNFLSATTAIAGAIVGLILIETHESSAFIIPFAAGNFIYIAASNLVPQLHRHCKIKDTIIHILAIIIGILLIYLVTYYGPAHSH
ncbi:MAG: ZIP family metal transporter [archaeon]